MKHHRLILLLAVLFSFTANAQAKIFAVRMPAVLPTNPMIIMTNGAMLPISQIPSINVPGIVPTIGELPLPVISPITLPPGAVLKAPTAAPALSFSNSFSVHAVAVPLVDAGSSLHNRSSRRDTVENRLKTARLVETIRKTLNLDDDATTLEDLEGAFDGRDSDHTADSQNGPVVLPEHKLEEELGLR
ncbi:MAG: hypothetical protein COB53_11810 [Elusimicrobia bacterium]|nr:MAG: hypothetical protein COB53_11810 [Elusimicrobiota bacterium]